MIRTLLLASGLLAVLAATPASAQSRRFCPEGRTASGACVNPQLAAAMRQQAICYSQVKLSFIVCPGTLPSRDVDLKFPQNAVVDRFRELNAILERPRF